MPTRDTQVVSLFVWTGAAFWLGGLWSAVQEMTPTKHRPIAARAAPAVLFSFGLFAFLTYGAIRFVRAVSS